MTAPNPYSPPTGDAENDSAGLGTLSMQAAAMLVLQFLFGLAGFALGGQVGLVIGAATGAFIRGRSMHSSALRQSDVLRVALLATSVFLALRLTTSLAVRPASWGPLTDDALAPTLVGIAVIVGVYAMATILSAITGFQTWTPRERIISDPRVPVSDPVGQILGGTRSVAGPPPIYDEDELDAEGKVFVVGRDEAE